MFRHDRIFELVVEGAFDSVNWRDWVWSGGCSQDWIETHTEVRRWGQSLYIRVVQMQFPIVFFESTICISEGLETGQLQGSDAARKWHDVLLGARSRG